MGDDVLRSLVPDLGSVRGKRVVVTGGTTGIGRAVLLALSGQGAKVFTFGRDEADLQSALVEAREAGGDVHGITADVANLDDIRAAFAEADAWLGRLDVLVSNAAVSGDDFDQQSLEAIDYVVRTNVTGYLACVHEAVARMRGKGSGQVVLVGSMSADLREEGGSTYVATKAAIQGFAESLRKTVNEEGIRVSVVEPGKVATDMVGKSAKEMEKGISEGKMLRPADIAAMVLYVLLQPQRCDIVSVQIRPHGQVI